MESLESRHLLSAITVGNAIASEGSDLLFPVALDAPSAEAMTIKFAVGAKSAKANRNFLKPLVNTITINPGETTANIVVNTLDDLIDAPDKTLTLRILSVKGHTVLTKSALGTIVDIDAAPVITLGDVTVNEPRGKAGTTVAKFNLGLSGKTEFPVTVDFTTADGTATAASGNYLGVFGTAKFSRGKIPAAKIRVKVKNDLQAVPGKTFDVNILNAINATIVDDRATATIVDSGVGGGGGGTTITISSSDKVVSEAQVGGVVHVPVTLDQPAASLVTVHFQTVDIDAIAGNDYIAQAGTLECQPGQTAQNIAITLVGDNNVEGDEHFAISFDSPVGATLGVLQSVVTIVDDDSYKFSNLSFSTTSAPLTDQHVTFSVTLDSSTSQPVAGATVQFFFAPQGANLDELPPVQTFATGTLAPGESFTRTDQLLDASFLVPTPGVWQWVARAVNASGGVSEEVFGPTYSF